MKAKSSGSPSPQKSPSTPAAPTTYHDRALAGMSPLKEQFEPTEAMPVPQHYKMAGGA